MRNSRSNQRNPGISEWTKDYVVKDNLAFFADALAAVQAKGRGNRGLMTIGFVGHRDMPGVMLRSAQSVLRWDKRPSLWSHVFLIAEPVESASAANGDTPILEIPIWPRYSCFPRPDHNGVFRGKLSAYADRQLDANVGLLAFRLKGNEASAVKRRAEDFNYDRFRFNHWESLGVWHAYLWAQDTATNPLRENVPIPSASYIDMAYEAIGIDVTPGANERHSAPEHIWNAACWWHEAFKKRGHPVCGYFVKRDPGCAMLGTEELDGDPSHTSATGPAARRRATRSKGRPKRK